VHPDRMKERVGRVIGSEVNSNEGSADFMFAVTVVSGDFTDALTRSMSPGDIDGHTYTAPWSKFSRKV